MPQFPSKTNSGGIWSIKSQKRAKQGDNWASAPFIIPIGSVASDGATRHINFIDLNGNLLNSMSVGITSFSGAEYYRFGNIMYVFLGSNVTSYLRVDLSSFTYTSHTAPTQSGNGFFTPLSDSELISVSSNRSQYYIFNMATNSFTTTAYSAGTFTGIQQTHATLTFFDRAAQGVTNRQSRILWTANNTADGGGGEYNYATLSGQTLGTRTTNAYAMNSSRNYAMPVNNRVGLLWLFDNNLRRAYSTGTAIATIYPQNLSYNSLSYNYIAPQAQDAGGWGGGNHRGNVYGIWRAYNSSTATYAFEVCHFNPLISTSPAPTRLFSIGNGPIPSYNYWPAWGTVANINEAGYVAILWNDRSAGNNIYKMSMYNGSAQIGTTRTITLPSGHLPADSSANWSYYRMNPGTQTYLGPLLPGTNVVD